MIEIPIEPLFGSFDRVNFVFALFEAVSLTRVIVRLYSAAFLLENIHDLFAFFLWNARIVLTLQNQKRRPQVVKEFQRGGAFVHSGIRDWVSQQ